MQIEIPEQVITTNYEMVGTWDDPQSVKYIGEVLIDGVSVYQGGLATTSRLAEEDALYAFAIRLQEVLNG